jgi:hypothetical protein
MARWKYYAEVSDGGFGMEGDARDIVDMLKQTVYEMERRSRRKEVFKVIIEKIK